MKRLFYKIFLFSTLIILILSCSSTRSLRSEVKKIPAKNYENYSFSPNTKIDERIGNSDAIVLNWLRELDSNESYTFYELKNEERTQVKEYIKLLPKYYQSVLEKKLLGIYFINDFYGSGMSDYVISESNDIYTILVFNPKVFKQSLSELVTYKENTCYKQNNDQIQLNIQISDEYSGLFYILMHECTHIIDYCERITPFVEPNIQELQRKKKEPSPFTEEYWTAYNKIKLKRNIEYKDKLNFYTKENDKKIEKSELLLVYNELKNTPFASLYSYINWAEDFAEYATFYYFTQVLNMEYNIKITENNELIFEYEPFANINVLERAKKLEIFD